MEISTIPLSSFWISGLFHVIGILITISPQAMIMIDWQMWWQQHLLCTWSNKNSRYRMAAPRAKCKNYLLPVLEKGQSFDLIEYLYAHLPWHHAWNRDFIDLQQDWYTIFQIMFSSWMILLVEMDLQTLFNLFLIITMIIQINFSIS